SAHKNNEGVARPSSEGAGDPQERARGMPGARCTRSPCAKCSKHTVVTTGSPETPGIPCAVVLTAYAALSPETNSSCLRHRRIEGLLNPVEPIRPPPV